MSEDMEKDPTQVTTVPSFRRRRPSRRRSGRRANAERTEYYVDMRRGNGTLWH